RKPQIQIVKKHSPRSGAGRVAIYNFRYAVLLYLLRVQPGKRRGFVKVFSKSRLINLGFLAALVLATLLASVPSLGQSGRRAPATNAQPQDQAIKLRADEVLLNVTVVDPYGKQATDLNRDEFIVAEDGQRQD